MLVAGKEPADHLSPVIDPDRARSNAAVRAQLNQAAAAGPGHGVLMARVDIRHAGDAPALAQGRRRRSGTAKRANVDHAAGRRPHEAVVVDAVLVIECTRETCHQPGVVDVCAVGIQAAQRADVHHAAGRRPVEGMDLAVGRAGVAGDSAGIIDRAAARTLPGQRPQVDQPPCGVPHDCMRRVEQRADKLGHPGNLARLVDCRAEREDGVPQRAKVDHATRLAPAEGMHIFGRVRGKAGHLPRIVERRRDGRSAPQCADVLNARVTEKLDPIADLGMQRIDHLAIGIDDGNGGQFARAQVDDAVARAWRDIDDAGVGRRRVVVRASDGKKAGRRHRHGAG